MTTPPETPASQPGASSPPPFNVSEAFNYGWLKFQQNAGTILAAAAIYIIGAAALGVVWYLLVGAMTNVDSGALTGFFSLSLLLFGLAWFLLIFVVQAAVIRGALLVTKGVKLELSHFLSTENLGQIILAAVLLALGSAIGSFLCFLPGIIFAFFSQFTLYYVIDKNVQAFDAIKASFSLVNKNLGTTIALYLGVVIATFIGAILCGIGLLVTLPVALIATAYGFRKMNGEEVAA